MYVSELIRQCGVLLTFHVDLVAAEVAPRRKRIRTTTGSSDGRSSADDSGAEIVSSGRRRVGKRFRDKAKSARAAATNGSAGERLTSEDTWLPVLTLCVGL